MSKIHLPMHAREAVGEKLKRGKDELWGLFSRRRTGETRAAMRNRQARKLRLALRDGWRAA